MAVRAAEVATPLTSVMAVFAPPANVALAPLAGAVNVTVTFATGFPPPSATVTTSGALNVVLTTASCGVPLLAVIVAGGPTVFVIAKLAGPVPPGTVAVTV